MSRWKCLNCGRHTNSTFLFALHMLRGFFSRKHYPVTTYLVTPKDKPMS